MELSIRYQAQEQKQNKNLFTPKTGVEIGLEFSSPQIMVDWDKKTADFEITVGKEAVVEKIHGPLVEDADGIWSAILIGVSPKKTTDYSIRIKGDLVCLSIEGCEKVRVDVLFTIPGQSKVLAHVFYGGEDAPSEISVDDFSATSEQLFSGEGLGHRTEIADVSADFLKDFADEGAEVTNVTELATDTERIIRFKEKSLERENQLNTEIQQNLLASLKAQELVTQLEATLDEKKKLEQEVFAINQKLNNDKRLAKEARERAKREQERLDAQLERERAKADAQRIKEVERKIQWAAKEKERAEVQIKEASKRLEINQQKLKTVKVELNETAEVVKENQAVLASLTKDKEILKNEAADLSQVIAQVEKIEEQVEKDRVYEEAFIDKIDNQKLINFLDIDGGGRPFGFTNNGWIVNSSEFFAEASKLKASAGIGKQKYSSGLMNSLLEGVGERYFEYLKLQEPKVYQKAQQKDLVVNALSNKLGGQVGSHRSHQNGLDVDIGYLGKSGIYNEKTERWRLSSEFDPELNLSLFKYLVSLKMPKKAPEISSVWIIFVSKRIKKAFCEYAHESNTLERDYEVHRRIRGIKSHERHFHLRLRCPTGHEQTCNSPKVEPHGTGC